MNVTIYHDPRCRKSRATLALFEERGIDPTVIPYLDKPPSAPRLRALLGLLGLEPRALMRQQEPLYREQRLDRAALSDSQLIAAMGAHPILIERPIVVVEKGGNEWAALGRPPEAVLALL